MEYLLEIKSQLQTLLSIEILTNEFIFIFYKFSSNPYLTLGLSLCLYNFMCERISPTDCRHALFESHSWS